MCSRALVANRHGSIVGGIVMDSAQQLKNVDRELRLRPALPDCRMFKGVQYYMLITDI